MALSGAVRWIFGHERRPSKGFLISDMRGGKAEPVVEAMRIAARAIGGELESVQPAARARASASWISAVPIFWSRWLAATRTPSIWARRAADSDRPGNKGDLIAGDDIGADGADDKVVRALGPHGVERGQIRGRIGDLAACPACRPPAAR